MFEKLGGHVLIGSLDSCRHLREFERHAQHRGAVKSHPRRPVCLLQGATGRATALTDQTRRCCRSPRNPPEKRFLPLNILAIDPPSEVQQKLLKDTFEKIAVAVARSALDLIDAPRRPCVHRRIDIAKCKLISRNLTVRVHIPFAQEQDELRLGKLRVDVGQVESCEMPGPMPRTMDTPIYPASKSRRDYIYVATRRCDPAATLGRCSDSPDRRSTNPARCSDKTASTKADQRRPGGRHSFVIDSIRRIERGIKFVCFVKRASKI